MGGVGGQAPGERCMTPRRHVPRNRLSCNVASCNALLLLVEYVQHPLELFHGVVAMRREPDGTLAQRAYDMRPFQRVVGLDGVRGGEADDRGAVRLRAR